VSRCLAEFNPYIIIQAVYKIDFLIVSFLREADIIKTIPCTKYSISGGLLEAVLAFLYTEHHKKERERIS